MADSFNGYHVWLGIPPGEQPPNHYRLLGIALYETDLDVIDHAADRQMAHVRTFQSGRNGALSQQILNELAAARVCLLNSKAKANYDDDLRTTLAAKAAPLATAIPLNPAARPGAPAAPHPWDAPKRNTSKPLAPSPSAADGLAIGSVKSEDGILGLAPELAPVKSVAPAKPVTPAKPAVPVTPAPGSVVAPVSVVPVSAVTPGSGVAPVSVVAPVTAVTPAAQEDADPYGLSGSSARRPVAALNDDSFDGQIDSYDSRTAVNLARSRSTDALIQKLAIYGFVAVASLVLVLVFYGFLVRALGPPSEWFKQPVVAEPHIEPPKHDLPAAPAPAPAPPTPEAAASTEVM